jgi:hypothetical protein
MRMSLRAILLSHFLQGILLYFQSFYDYIVELCDIFVVST